MTLPEKRKGEQFDQGSQAKKPLHSFESTTQSGQARSISNKGMALPEPAPYDIVEDLTLVLPSQPLDFSAGFFKQKYARDIWVIFSEEAFVDRGLAEMHKAWLEASRPASQPSFPTDCSIGPKAQRPGIMGVEISV